VTGKGRGEAQAATQVGQELAFMANAMAVVVPNNGGNNIAIDL
jgi:hypothetical protein